MFPFLHRTALWALTRRVPLILLAALLLSSAGCAAAGDASLRPDSPTEPASAAVLLTFPPSPAPDVTRAATPTGAPGDQAAAAGTAVAVPAVAVPAATESAAAVPAALPVVERQGVTVRVDQATAEADRLVLVYRVSGLPADLFGPKRVPTLQAWAAAHADEPMPVQVRLPDGSALAPINGGHCSGSSDGSAARLTCESFFQPLPAGVDRITLEIRRFENALPGELPEDWAIPIPVRPVDAKPANEDAQAADFPAQTLNRVTLRLLEFKQGRSQTAFRLGVRWDDAPFLGAQRMLMFTAPITLQDDQGRYFLLNGAPGGGGVSPDSPNSMPLGALVTTPVDGSSPLTLRVDWMVFSHTGFGGQADTQTPRLRFDPAVVQRVGQEWTVDQTFSLGDAALHFTRARLKAAADGGVTLEYDFEAPPEVTGVILSPDGAEAASASLETGYHRVRGAMMTRVTLAQMPTRALDLTLTEVRVLVRGPWELTWQPQAQDLSAAPTATPAPTRLPPPSATPPPGQPVLDELRALLNRASAPRGPGWVQQEMDMEHIAPVDGLDSLEQPETPQRMQATVWSLLDDGGLVRSELILYKSADGQIVSSEVMKDAAHFSLPSGRGSVETEQTRNRLSPDGGFFQVLSGYAAEGGTVQKEESRLDGKPCWRFSGRLPYDPPKDFWGEPQPVSALRYSGCIDPASGTLLQTQGEMEYADGTTRISDVTRYGPFEAAAALPAEAQRLLDQLILP